MEENILNIDLNEIVSKEIVEKFKSYEKQIYNLEEKLTKSKSNEDKLLKKVEKSETLINLVNYLKDTYSKIKGTPKDKDGYGEKSKERNQFEFIEKILLTFFNITPEYKGWTYIHCGGGTLKVQLVINYYSNKEILINLLKVLLPENDSLFFNNNIISFIESFKMPFHWSKQDVLEYVKSPKYNTNGAIYGISSFWIEAGAGKSNMPHDLIMSNKHILESDIFNELLSTIKTKRSADYHYLFALPKYNSNITKEQIIQLGECLLVLTKDKLFYDHIKEFIGTNIMNFNNETLDYLYTFINSDNQYKTTYWENFSHNYQMKFLMSKPIDELLKILTSYNNKWTNEEKEEFLKKYFKEQKI